ncbi:hypothetical protein IWQ62_001730 [Dispira parvispora]|uniref:PH domain-containing protein n=1 Tax=Dispira parvispora TaxID=1520584 RepID=A0A9W8ARN2_9FUNG|nr:hypothetical protein IWQ62_001730 [Dispira parvispora]
MSQPVYEQPTFPGVRTYSQTVHGATSAPSAPSAQQPSTEYANAERTITPPRSTTSGLSSMSMGTEAAKLAAKSTDPTYLFMGRLHGLKTLVKSCRVYFQGIAEAEMESARRFGHLAGQLPVPIREDHVFMSLGENGLQDLFHSVKAVTDSTSNFQYESSRGITAHVLPLLDELSEEVKRRYQYTNQRLKGSQGRLMEQRHLCQAEFNKLSSAVALARTTPDDLMEDPFLASLDVKRQLHQRASEEAIFYKWAVHEQTSFLEFETKVIKQLKEILHSQFGLFARDLGKRQQNAQSICQACNMMDPEVEWRSFCERHSDVLVDPKSGPVTAQEIPYPHRDDPALQVVKEGYIQVQAHAGLNRRWKDYYAVLSSLGFLHLFVSGDLVHCRIPALSLFLPRCTLGALHMPDLPQNSFSISARSKNLRDKAGRFYLVRMANPALVDSWWKAMASKVRVHMVPDASNAGFEPKVLLEAGNADVNGRRSRSGSGYGASQRSGSVLSESDFNQEATMSYVSQQQQMANQGPAYQETSATQQAAEVPQPSTMEFQQDMGSQGNVPTMESMTAQDTRQSAAGGGTKGSRKNRKGRRGKPSTEETMPGKFVFRMQYT